MRIAFINYMTDSVYHTYTTIKDLCIYIHANFNK